MAHEFNPSKGELKQLLRALNRGLKSFKKGDLAPRTPCPNSWTLASYVTGELDDKTRRTINAHIAFCDSCFEEYAALAGPEKIADILSIGFTPWASNLQELWDRWPRIRDDKEKCIVDLGRTYGIGTQLGPVQIAAERPAFWKSILSNFLSSDPDDTFRAGSGELLFKQIEIQVGENSYRIELSLLRGEIVCKISGLHTPLQVPLRIVLWETKDGKELSALGTDHTDDFGNTEIPVVVINRGVTLILTLVLRDREQLVGFRIPANVPYASIADLLAEITQSASPKQIEDHLKRMKDGIDALLPFLRRQPHSESETHVIPTRERNKEAQASVVLFSCLGSSLAM